MVKHLPAVQETQVQSLGQEDSLEKGKQLPTPVFLPKEFHRQRSCSHSPLSHRESNTTELLTLPLGSFYKILSIDHLFPI